MNVMLAVFGLGGGEIVVILLVVLLLFGARKLPELAKGLGQGIREFKKASNEVTDEIHRSIDEPPSPPQRKLPTEGSEPQHSVSQSEPKNPPH